MLLKCWQTGVDNVDVHNTCSKHKLLFLVLHNLQKLISFRPVDFATSLFITLLLQRKSLRFLFLLHAIMGGLLKALQFLS